MFLRASTRNKDGKQHQYWSIVENRRLADGRVLQRHVLYLGEINSSQQRAWRKSVEVFDEREHELRALALFPEDRLDECATDDSVVRLRLSQLRLCRPRVWGSCWLAVKLWERLQLDQFWAARLAKNRKGTRWDQVLFVLVASRLLSPGSEWRLHRQWFERSALADLLGVDAGVADIHKLYACHDRLFAHKRAVFDHLVRRWRDLFNVDFDVLLFCMTSRAPISRPTRRSKTKTNAASATRATSEPTACKWSSRWWSPRRAYRWPTKCCRATPSITARCAICSTRIEQQYGKARRVWVMDRGIPTEEVLQQMRAERSAGALPGGHPKGRLSKLEKDLIAKPWHEARPGVRSSCCPRTGRCTCLRRARIASPRNGRCAADN